jgi:hypothetical protein
MESRKAQDQDVKKALSFQEAKKSVSKKRWMDDRKIQASGITCHDEFRGRGGPAQSLTPGLRVGI